MMEKKLLNKALVKQAIVALQSNRRQATSHVKTRGEVSGGGKKPWRQKGTGRARAGSSRSPIWIGGGKVFGPTRERHYKQQLPKKMARLALGQLFNYYLQEEKLVLIEHLNLKEVKTKAALGLLKKHGADNRRALLITNEIEPELVVSARNLPGVKVTANANVSILDLAEAQIVLIDKKAAVNRGLVKAEVPAKKPVAKETK